MLDCDDMDMLEHLRSRWFDPALYSGVWIEPGISMSVAFWNCSDPQQFQDYFALWI